MWHGHAPRSARRAAEGRAGRYPRAFRRRIAIAVRDNRKRRPFVFPLPLPMQSTSDAARGRGRLAAPRLADALQAPHSAAVKCAGDVLRGPPIRDLLHSPLAGKRPGDVRLPDPVEISLGPRGPCQCVKDGLPIPLNLALWRPPSAVTVGFDCQSPPPRYVCLVIVPGPGTSQSEESGDSDRARADAG